MHYYRAVDGNFLFPFGVRLTWQDRNPARVTDRNRSSSVGTHLECEISEFRREVYGISALLGCYTDYSGNSSPTFWDNPSVHSSRVKNYKKEAFRLGFLYSWR